MWTINGNHHPHRIRVVGLLSLVGTLFYISCLFSHVCMAGHMQHAPYSAYDWVNDLLWATCFASVMVLSVSLQARGRLLFLLGSFALILSRIVFESLGGGGILIEAPLLITLDVYGLLYLCCPKRFLRAPPSGKSWSGISRLRGGSVSAP
jgi:hypothetical protein